MRSPLREQETHGSDPIVDWLADGLKRDGHGLIRTSGLTCEALLDIAGRFGNFWSATKPVLTVRYVHGSGVTTEGTGFVPPHNECSYQSVIPRYVALYCCDRGESGGDFFLVDSAKVIEQLGPAYREAAACTVFRVQSPRSGEVTERPLVARHPYYPATQVLIYSSIGGLRPGCSRYELLWGPHELSTKVLERVEYVLADRANFAAHTWSAGDLLIFDNYRFLHGRYAYSGRSRTLWHVRLT